VTLDCGIQDLPVGMADLIEEIVPVIHRSSIHSNNQVPALQPRTAGRHPSLHWPHKRRNGQITERTISITYVSGLHLNRSFSALPVALDAHNSIRRCLAEISV